MYICMYTYIHIYSSHIDMYAHMLFIDICFPHYGKHICKQSM